MFRSLGGDADRWRSGDGGASSSAGAGGVADSELGAGAERCALPGNGNWGGLSRSSSSSSTSSAGFGLLPHDGSDGSSCGQLGKHRHELTQLMTQRVEKSRHR